MRRQLLSGIRSVASLCSFWGGGGGGEGVSSEINFVRFAGLLRTFVMAPRLPRSQSLPGMLDVPSIARNP